MIPEWVERFIGIPFQEKKHAWDGSDCYGLVHLVYSSIYFVGLNEWDNLYDNVSPTKKLGEAFDTGKKEDNWFNIQTDVRTADVLVFRINGFPAHCGIVVDPIFNLMLHTTPMHGSALIENYKSLVWGPKIAYILRHPKIQIGNEKTPRQQAIIR